MSLAALAVWSASLAAGALALAAAALVGALLWDHRRGSRLHAAALVVLLWGILAGFWAHRQVSSTASAWDRYWDARQEEVGARLDRTLQAWLAAAEEAADALAARADEVAEARRRDLLSAPARDVQDLPWVRLVRQLRQRHGVAALALYDASGAPLAWDGVHRGRVPEDVQRGEARYAYRDVPLFGYLYVTSMDPEGRVAVAAQLMRTGVSPELGADLGDFQTEFSNASGERIRVTAESPPADEGVFDLVDADGERMLSVVLQEPDPGARMEAVMARWRVRVAGLVVLAWLLLAAGARPLAGAGVMASGALLWVVGFLPVELMPGLQELFRPEVFQLPGPVPLTLGRLTLLTLAGFLVVALVRAPRPRLPWWLVAPGAVGGVLAVERWVHAGMSGVGSAPSAATFVSHAIVVSGAGAVVLGVALHLARGAPTHRKWITVMGVVSGLAVGALGGMWVSAGADLPGWWPMLLILPVVVAAAGLAAWEGWGREVVTWVTAVTLATAVGVPTAWAASVQRGIQQGSEYLTTLASPQDARLERSLLQLAEEAELLHEAGRSPVDIMYGAWRRSGLAELPHAARLATWTGEGVPGPELRIGVRGDPPRLVGDVVTAAQAAGTLRLERPNRDDARWVMAVPFGDGSALSVTVPGAPLDPASSPLSALVGGATAGRVPPVTLIPLLPGDPTGEEDLVWVRTKDGWQGEIAVSFDNARFHAHLLVPMPGFLLSTARGTLLLTLHLAAFFALWLGGRVLRRDLVPPDLRWSRVAISFRARVTLALFGFFLLANAVFGTAAFRTLTQAAARSAQVIAERIVEDAAGWYLSLDVPPGTRMERVSRQVRAELLEYRAGELRGGGSVAELMELGLYEAWLPLEQHLRLDGREGLHDFTERALGRWRYVTAYRRLPDGDILGAQVPVQAGTTAIDTTDLIELMAFAVLLGAALSLVLAWMAGRALTSPIRILQAASERVGAGNLSVQLPSERGDEFGAVFRSFNRMVSRLRRARRQLVRTSRRTQTIMEEAAVGMVALDATGRVVLVNPTAEELLGAELALGRPIPAAGHLGSELAAWVHAFLASGAEEAGTELQEGERRIRVRARRLGGLAEERGAVVALDDVTDELRTERILAWGEMARQVAHEVKNPLTPIKLSIQHIRRAWQDGHPDFDAILVKNADAMLREIDRLATIAQSFSRFGAPGGVSESPLQSVSAAEVVEDVMALYGGGALPGMRLQCDIEEGLPPVRARASELKEVLINLLENARVALRDGGAVRVEVRGSGPDSVEVAVVDDGAGIPPELLPRIFEPRFSTRSGGAGLGLPIVRRIVSTWGGDVRVDSTPGHGTRVTVRIPVWRDRA